MNGKTSYMYCSLLPLDADHKEHVDHARGMRPLYLDMQATTPMVGDWISYNRQQSLTLQGSASVTQSGLQKSSKIEFA